MFRFLSLASAIALGAMPLAAGDLVYSPTNPSFGGNALNSAHLLGLANAQRTATARDFMDPEEQAELDEMDPGRTDAELFISQLQSRLFSSLAAQVNDAIFGDNSTDNGTVTFGSTTVDFTRSTEEITLVITDALDGTVTEISVPQLVSNP